MPIRFRCAYCNQLMGIARRKAGMVVRCPTCAGQVVVPNPNPGSPPEPEPAEKPGNGPAPPLFERSDFDQVFDPPGGTPAVGGGAAAFDFPQNPFVPIPQAPAPQAPAPQIQAPFPQQPPFGPNDPIAFGEPEGQAAGIFLSPGKATLLSVLAVVFLALAFGAGLLVGLSLRSAPAQKSGRAPAAAPTIQLAVTAGSIR